MSELNAVVLPTFHNADMCGGISVIDMQTRQPQAGPVTSGERPLYLVLEPDVIVGDDLRETVCLHDPSAEVHLARDIDAAYDALDALPPLRAAVLNASIADLTQSGLASRISSAGGTVVVLNGTERPEDKDATGWTFVQRPFSSEAVIEALEAALQPTPPGTIRG